MDLVLGVDIGGTTTDLGLVDRGGAVLAARTLETRGREPAAAFFPRLVEAAHALQAQTGGGLRAVGVGAPNGDALGCRIADPPNLAWGVVDLRAALAPLSVPVAADNDANAAALGELRWGAGRGLRHLLAVTLGTGLGTGLIVDGRLVHGGSGVAGELGHVTVDPSGRRCGCGRRGCLETYASATGLVRTVREWLGSRIQPSTLRDLDPAGLTARAVHDAARAGDPLALEAFAWTGTLLGRKLAEAVALTSPEAVVLMGGLAAAGDLVLDPVREALEAALFAPFRGTVRVLPSAVPGNPAVLGAAALAWAALEAGSGRA